MNIRNILFALLFIPSVSFSQLMFEVDYASQADIKYWVTDYQYQADAQKHHWYWCDYAYQADLKVYFVDREYQADLKVFRVRYSYLTR